MRRGGMIIPEGIGSAVVGMCGGTFGDAQYILVDKLFGMWVCIACWVYFFQLGGLTPTPDVLRLSNETMRCLYIGT